jgi:hypothetical protein
MIGVDDVDPVPEGAVLVHIGPPKTGTTSLQGALHERRSELHDHGVVYPGTTRRHKRPGFALLKERDVPISEWHDLAAEVREARDARVCVSTENFARARRRQVRTIVQDLGADRVHMVVTARRLDRLMPSAWQQRIKDRVETLPYPEWVDRVLDPQRPKGPSATFWRHHDLGATIAHWRQMIPADRIIVIAADESDRSQILRVFEGLLALPEGWLQSAAEAVSSGAVAPGRAQYVSNTSLSYERVELLRRLNVALESLGPETSPRRRLVADLRRGVFAGPREPSETTMPGLPAAALARVAELNEQRNQAVLAAGVRIVGDLGRLTVPVDDPAEEMIPPPTTVPIGVAVEAMAAALGRVPASKPVES